MKTIEERAEEHWAVEWEKPNGSFKNAIIAALTELAADLQAEHERSVNALNDTLSLNMGQLMEAQNRLAEKEKEVAELNDRISWLETQREVECQQKLDAQKEGEGFSVEVAELKEKLATLAKDYSEVVAGESEMEELTKLRALLDEVKRVLGAVAGCKLFYEDSMDIDNHTTDDVNNLLTRLGGSHE